MRVLIPTNAAKRSRPGRVSRADSVRLLIIIKIIYMRLQYIIICVNVGTKHSRNNNDNNNTIKTNSAVVGRILRTENRNS